MAESKELEGLTKFLDPDFGSLVAPASFDEADKLRLAVGSATRDLRLRFWPEQVRREDAARDEEARQKQEAIDKAAVLKEEADPKAQQVHAAEEEAAQAEKAKELAAGQERARINHESWLATRAVNLTAKERADAAELQEWLARNREALPQLIKDIDALRGDFNHDNPQAAKQACVALYAAYANYVSKALSIPPPPAEKPAKVMDSSIRAAAEECKQGNITYARNLLTTGYEQAGQLAKLLEK